MIVVNKRYYDYDYDNNTIIMFDAEDVGLTLDLDAINDIEYMIPTHSAENAPSTMESERDHESEAEECTKSKNPKLTASDPSNIQSQSQSTDTVPDIIPHPQPVANSADNTDEKTPGITPPSSNSNKASSSHRGHINWISSVSPKGSRRIPYALHIAHSYTCNKLPVSLSHLVDITTIQKQQQQQAQKKKAAAAAAAALYHQQHQQQQQQQQQQQHAMYPQYVGHPIPPHHSGHPGHPHHGIYPSYGYPPPHHSRNTPYHHHHHQHHGHHQQRDPYLSPPSYHTPPHHPMTAHPHRHTNTQRKQDIPAASPRGYPQTATTQQQKQQYLSYNTTSKTTK